MTDINRLGKDFANLFKDPDEFIGTSSGMPNTDGTINVTRQDGGQDGGTVNAILANNGRSPVTLCQRINGQWYAWREGEAQVTGEQVVLQRRSQPTSKPVADEIGILYFKKDYTPSSEFVVCATDYGWGAHVSYLNFQNPIGISLNPASLATKDTDVVKEGRYPNLQETFPGATENAPTDPGIDPDTFDALTIAPQVIVEIWELRNFQGKKVFEAMGPFVVTTQPIVGGVVLQEPWQSIYGNKKRLQDTPMQPWVTGSIKIYKPKLFFKFASNPNKEIPIELGSYYFGYASLANQKHSWLSNSQCCYVTTTKKGEAYINLHLTQVTGNLPATRTITVRNTSILEDVTTVSPATINKKNEDWQKDWAYIYNETITTTRTVPVQREAPCYEKYQEKNANFRIENNQLYLLDLEQVKEDSTLREISRLKKQKAIVQKGIATTVNRTCSFNPSNTTVQFPKLGTPEDEVEILAVSVLLKK